MCVLAHAPRAASPGCVVGCTLLLLQVAGKGRRSLHGLRPARHMAGACNPFTCLAVGCEQLGVVHNGGHAMQRHACDAEDLVHDTMTGGVLSI